MSEDIIKKYNLSEAVKRIHQINEYTFYDSTVTEDDQEASADGGMGGQDPNMGGGEMLPMNGGADQGQNGEMPPMGGGMEGQDPNMGGEGMPMDGGQQPMGGDQQPPMEDPNDGDMGMPPMGNMGEGEEIEDVEMDEDTAQPGDEVIDVDELTQSQETTEFKLDDVDDKLDKVLKIISKFSDAIEANDAKIEDLKQEFAKRNPTAEETLNLRSMASHPYSERPDEYWRKQQETHPNYRIMSDNDVPTSEEQKEFEIRKSDIDNFNERDIMKSLGENHIKLSDFLRF